MMKPLAEEDPVCPSNNIHQDPFDDNENITFSRRAARYLSQFNWYYPKSNNSSNNTASRPSLDDAWSHYEHVTLARCYENHQSGTFENDFVRAPTQSSEGEQLPTRLYPVWETPLKELADFGVSQRMFFSTLLVLSGIMFLASLLNVPMMIYFWGYAGDDNKEGVDYLGTNTIRGSALCDATEWVECETCNSIPEEYPAYRLDGKYVQRNLCDFDSWLLPGLFSFAASILLLFLMGVFFWKQRAAEVIFDEEVQTASDYSIKVSNPPPDATNPEEWRQFFNQYVCQQEGKGVVLVTIALDNAKLIQALVQRRKKLIALSKLLPHDTDMTDMPMFLKRVNNLLSSEKAGSSSTSSSSWLSTLICGCDSSQARQLWSEIEFLEEKIRLLSQEKFQAVAVFVTFETERAQRNALHALSTGRLHVWQNRIDTTKLGDGDGLRVFEAIESRSSMWSLREEQEERIIRLTSSSASYDNNGTKLLTFRNYHVLSVKEAMEPSDVRWVDLQSSSRKRLELYMGSTIGMIVFVLCSGFFIYQLMVTYPGTYYGTIFITLTNCIVPFICELVTNFESHPTEHGKQMSLYAKITIFRWFNSAIALSLISSFVESISLQDGRENMQQQTLIYKVYPVILAELFFNPIFQMMDPLENFKKHILAPRARDQEEMNAYFSGARFWLAERYTDANKVLFVALFFSSILPEAFLLGSLALLAQFCVGKFALLRLCGRTTDVGFYLSRLSRNYFIPFVLVTHVVMSAYWWSGYPYDNVCTDEEGGYTYCNQDFWSAGIFPPLPRFQPEGAKWMSKSQEKLTSLYGWTSVAVLLCSGAAFLYNVIIPKIQSLYKSTYEPDGADQGIGFSSVVHLDELHGYIPQVKDEAFVFPMLVCDVSGIDENLIGWKDKARGYSPHNLIDDVYAITRSKPLHPIFSTVTQFDPTL